MNKFIILRRVGKQPLLVAAGAILLIGFIAAAISWGTPNPRAALSPMAPQPGPALHTNSDNNLDQNSQSQAVNPQVAPPPVQAPPAYSPCNSCTPTAGRACPAYVIYPCTPCQGTPKAEMACEVPLAP